MSVTPAEWDDLIDAGMRLYESRLQEILERESLGQVVAIEPKTGDYAVGSDSFQATRLLKERHPRSLFFVRRIGLPTAEDRRLASRMAAAELKTK